MKGALAVFLSIAEWISTKRLRNPFHIALTGDEEGVFQSANSLVNFAKIEPDLVIVGEPTELKYVTNHKGFSNYLIEVFGNASHLSNADISNNAIHNAVDFLTQIRRDFSARVFTDSEFNDPRTSVNVGTITGGEYTNITPDYCRFTLDIRKMPGDIVDYKKHITDISKRMQLNIRITEQLSIPHFKSSLRIDGESRSFATEAGIYESVGWPTLVFGPGELDQAHTKNESIASDNLVLYEVMLKRLLMSKCL